MRDRDTWLNATVIELAGVGDADADPADHARLLVTRLAELLAPTEVFLLIPDPEADSAADAERPAEAKPATVAGSSELAARLACLRGPELAAATAARGMRVHFILPMRHQGDTIGAVSVLSADDQAPSETDIRLARTLIEVATISFLRRRELQRSQQVTRQLQHALDSRVIIEQGKGAVAAWLGVTPDEAFEMMRKYARAHSTRLPQVAEDVLGRQISATALTGTLAASPTKRTRRRRRQDESAITS